MINFINLMSTLTITISILLLLLLLLEKFLGISEIYLLLKVIGAFSLIPAVIIIIIYIFHYANSNYLQYIYTDDFSYMSLNNGLRKFSINTEPEIFQINTIVFVIWCIGFLLTFFIGLIQSIFSLKGILYSCVPINDKISQLAEGLKEEMQIHYDVSIYLSNKIMMPFTTGIIRKKIILPNVNLNENEWEMILKHELMHCIRQDVLMKILVRLVQKIHWFNPILFLYKTKFNEISEYTCDINVCSNYDESKKREYGELILKMSKDSIPQKLVIGFSDKNVKILKKRMEYIMLKKKTAKKASAAITIIMFIMTCPIITYAAASGTSVLENNMLLKYQENKSILIEQSVKGDAEIKIDSGITNNQVCYLGFLDTRGTNNIDTTISSNGEVQFSSVLMNANSSIRAVIYSEHETDNFRVGVISPDGIRYYSNSEQGAVVNTFNISSNGSYIVYIEGRNGKNGNSIHVSGTIYINN